MSQKDWRNRIVGQGIEAAGQLLANPANWRIHPKSQQEAMAGALNEIGWIQQVIVNKTTGNLIDGHLRVVLALRQGEETPVPVEYIELSEAEEALALATLDPIGAMAMADKQKLNELISEINTSEEALQKLLGDLYNKEIESGGKNILPEIPDELEGAFMLRPGMKFNSKQSFDIPELKSDKILNLDFSKLELWPGDDLRSTINKDNYMLLIYGNSCVSIDFEKTVIAFYTSDEKFEHLWRTPDKFTSKCINVKAKGVVSPNYSLWPDDPLAARIWQTYRSRWVSRYMQEANIMILPDVNWSLESDFDYCFAGIPEGSPVSIQCQNVKKNDIEDISRAKSGIIEAIRIIKPEKILFYVSNIGEELIKSLELKTDHVFIHTLMDHRRSFLKKERAGGLK